MKTPISSTVWTIAAWNVILPPPSSITVAKKIGAKIAPRLSTLRHDGGLTSRPRRLPLPVDGAFWLFVAALPRPLPTRPAACAALLALDGLLDAVLVDVDEVVVVPLLLRAPSALLLRCHRRIMPCAGTRRLRLR